MYKLFGRLTAAEYQVSRKRSTVRRLSRSATKKLVASPSQAGGDESRSATLTSTKGGGSPLKNAHLAPPAVPEDVSVEMLVDPEAAAALAKMEAAEALLSPEERERIQLQRAIAAGLDPDPRKRVLLPEQFTKLPQLVNNPFKDRIAKIYSKNEREAVGFEEFLDFLSVFSAEVG